VALAILIRKRMDPISFPQFVAGLLTIVLAIVGARRFDMHLLRLLQQLRQELRRLPIYSAETTRGTEAEFIRDRLPTKSAITIALLVVLVFGAVGWWLTR
jgi:hypothetical protein